MGLIRGLGRRIRAHIRPAASSSSTTWVGFARGLLDALRHYFIPKRAQRTESFDDALTRLKIDEPHLASLKQQFLRLARIFVFLAFLAFCYTTYLFSGHYWRAGVLGLVMTFLSLAFAFRYHFWWFQMREQRLGCTVKSWFFQGLLGQTGGKQ